MAEAARNDAKILESARAVFVADPEAPIAAVAKHAGVGIGALYRRYAGKESLLRALCADGLRRYIEAAESALADEQDPWRAFAAFMHREVDADASSLTQRLAGTFTPTPTSTRRPRARASSTWRCSPARRRRARSAPTPPSTTSARSSSSSPR